MATLATITPILKEVYGPRIVEQLNNDVLTLTRIQKSTNGVTSDIGGKYVTFPIHISRNAGIGSRLENEALPAAGNQGFDAARIGLKYGYGAFNVTGPTVALSDTNTKAFAKVIDEETTGLTNDLKKDMNRQMYADGSGVIATCNTIGTTVNTFTVKDARLAQVGEIVDLITLPNTVSVSARTVTAVVVSTGVITLSGAAFSSTVGEIMVRTGSGPSSTAGNRELTGLGAIVSASGVLFNIDPSVDSQWQSVIFGNSGTNRALSEALMIQVADQIRTNGGSTSVIFTSLGVRRSYFNLLSQTRQTVNTTEFTGGFSGLVFTTDKGEIPVVADVDAPLNKMWFINEDALTYYHDEDWHWLDRDGSMWKVVRDSSGNVFDSWNAYMGEYHELGTNRRNTHGQLQDITES